MLEMQCVISDADRHWMISILWNLWCSLAASRSLIDFVSCRIDTPGVTKRVPNNHTHPSQFFVRVKRVRESDETYSEFQKLVNFFIQDIIYTARLVIDLRPFPGEGRGPDSAVEGEFTCSCEFHLLRTLSPGLFFMVGADGFLVVCL